jgi:hypothetical protein
LPHLSHEIFQIGLTPTSLYLAVGSGLVLAPILLIPQRNGALGVHAGIVEDLCPLKADDFLGSIDIVSEALILEGGRVVVFEIAGIVDHELGGLFEFGHLARPQVVLLD